MAEVPRETGEGMKCVACGVDAVVRFEWAEKSINLCREHAMDWLAGFIRVPRGQVLTVSEPKK